VKKLASLNRILTLDLLRGYFLIVIILNHLHFYPSGLEWITGQSYLYASTAEGFFLISGIVLGIVRGAKLLEKPFAFAAKLLWQRSAQLYVTSIILVLIFTLLGWLFMEDPGAKLGVYQAGGSALDLLWKTVSLQYVYGWADYLRLYAIFIFFAPLALWLLRKGLWYVVLLASLVVWALYPVSPFPAGELSQPVSWQLVFFGGFVLGYHWNALQLWWERLSQRIKRWTVRTILIASAITLAANALLVFGHDIPGIGGVLAEINVALGPFVNKDQLPLTRIALFALWFCALYYLFHRFEPAIKKYAGWLLLSFGTNSLYAYTVQAFVVFFVLLAFDTPSKWWPINLLISIGTVGLVYLAIRTKFLMKIIPR
jgi:hypothetical protein